ncbi:hypothetical protein ACFL2Q_08505 [Thermodesulfobacteriota bacterium]
MTGLFRQRLLVSPRRLILEQLEERIVLDGSVSDVSQEQNADQSQDSPTQDGPCDGAQPTEASGQPQEAEPNLDQVYGVDLSVVLISNALDDVEAISAAVDESAHVVVYDASTVDLEGVGDILSGIVEANDGKKGLNKAEPIE